MANLKQPKVACILGAVSSGELCFLNDSANSEIYTKCLEERLTKAHGRPDRARRECRLVRAQPEGRSVLGRCSSVAIGDPVGFQAA